MPYTIYKITNTINQKMYIGITRQSLDKRWKSHIRDVKYAFQKAIQKYGHHHFIKQVIEVVQSEEEALEREAYWIQHYNTVKKGYNILARGSRKSQHIKTYKIPVVAIHILEKRPIYFESILDCERALGIQASAISKIVKNKSHTYHNYTFLSEETFNGYQLEDIINAIPKKKNIKKRKVEAFILETKEPLKIFDTLTEGARHFNTTPTHVSSVCRGDRNAAGKYNGKKIGWRYL